MLGSEHTIGLTDTPSEYIHFNYSGLSVDYTLVMVNLHSQLGVSVRAFPEKERPILRMGHRVPWTRGLDRMKKKKEEAR